MRKIRASLEETAGLGGGLEIERRSCHIGPFLFRPSSWLLENRQELFTRKIAERQNFPHGFSAGTTPEILGHTLRVAVLPQPRPHSRASDGRGNAGRWLERELGKELPGVAISMAVDRPVAAGSTLPVGRETSRGS